MVTCNVPESMLVQEPSIKLKYMDLIRLAGYIELIDYLNMQGQFEKYSWRDHQREIIEQVVAENIVYGGK